MFIKIPTVSVFQTNTYDIEIFWVNSGLFGYRHEKLTPALLVVLVTNMRYVESLHYMCKIETAFLSPSTVSYDATTVTARASTQISPDTISKIQRSRTLS